MKKELCIRRDSEVEQDMVRPKEDILKVRGFTSRYMLDVTMETTTNT